MIISAIQNNVNSFCKKIVTFKIHSIPHKKQKVCRKSLIFLRPIVFCGDDQDAKRLWSSKVKNAQHSELGDAVP